MVLLEAVGRRRGGGEFGRRRRRREAAARLEDPPLLLAQPEALLAEEDPLGAHPAAAAVGVADERLRARLRRLVDLGDLREVPVLPAVGARLDPLALRYRRRVVDDELVLVERAGERVGGDVRLLAGELRVVDGAAAAALAAVLGCCLLYTSPSPRDRG